ncbi:MAG: hypothetical protein MUE83_13470 [Tabrizicola sp.]|nr:hypothetical protein [Tabrizicola sp.]
MVNVTTPNSPPNRRVSGRCGLCNLFKPNLFQSLRVFRQASPRTSDDAPRNLVLIGGLQQVFLQVARAYWISVSAYDAKLAPNTELDAIRCPRHPNQPEPVS